MRFNKFTKGEGFEEFFLRGGLDGKGWSFFLENGSGFLEIAIINFTSRFLFDLIFACRLKDVSVIIFHFMF